MMTCDHFHSEGPQVFGVTVHSLVVTETWRLGFVRRWLNPPIKQYPNQPKMSNEGNFI